MSANDNEQICSLDQALCELGMDVLLKANGKL